jgi:hypothetical protein
MTVYERRAAGILYNLLRTRDDRRTLLVPGNICSIVPETLRAANQPFELVDIAEPHLNMDAERCLARAREEDVGGVLYVRTYGNEADPGPLFAALRGVRNDLLLIDDKCLCRPDVDGASTSPSADVTLFSTGRVKYADLGHGGFAHLRDGVAYRRFEGPGWLELSEPDMTWSRYRAQVLAEAAAADVQKEALNAIYTGALPAEVQLPPELQRWRFNIRVPEPDRLIETVFASGSFASRHYAAGPACPVAERLHAEVVNLFNDRYFDPDRARQITRLVTRHLER